MRDREVVLQLKVSRRMVAVAAMIFAFALGAVAVGTVFAQDTTTINGCVNKKTGALRVVSDPSACTSGETPISWNQQGPPGADGVVGTDGQDGKTILNGSGTPAADLGSEGDFYIDTSANDIYGPKSAGGWGSPTSLVGPAGSGGDADTLDSKDSTEFAAADHQHVTRIQQFGGQVSNELFATPTQWSFAGPTASVTVTNGQRITGAAQAPLGLTYDTSDDLLYGLCYQATDAESFVIPFTYDGSSDTESPSRAEVSTTRIPFAASETISGLTAGSYDVGFCVRAATPDGFLVLDDNGYVNGWVMVTND